MQISSVLSRIFEESNDVTGISAHKQSLPLFNSEYKNIKEIVAKA